MKKSMKKIISYVLALSMLVTGNIPIFAQSLSVQTNNQEINITANGVYIEGRFYSQYEFKTLLETYSLGALIAGTWWIPGVGEVVITVAGSIIVTGTIIEAGSWIYDTVMEWFENASAKKEAEEAVDKIPNKLKKKNKDDVVDLDKFKDKNGKTPNDKNSGTFVSVDDKRYTIEKDTAGHTGYDGTTKKWKLFLGKDRIASLNSSGKVVGK